MRSLTTYTMFCIPIRGNSRTNALLLNLIEVFVGRTRNPTIISLTIVNLAFRTFHTFSIGKKGYFFWAVLTRLIIRIPDLIWITGYTFNSIVMGKLGWTDAFFCISIKDQVFRAIETAFVARIPMRARRATQALTIFIERGRIWAIFTRKSIFIPNLLTQAVYAFEPIIEREVSWTYTFSLFNVKD